MSTANNTDSQLLLLHPKGNSTLWSHTEKLRGSGFSDNKAIATIAITCFFFATTIFVYSRQGRIVPLQGGFLIGGGHVAAAIDPDGRPTKKAFSRFPRAIGFLMAYYLFNIINLFITEAAIKVKDPYILINSLILAFQLLADILIVYVIVRVVGCILARYKAKIFTEENWLRFSEFALLVISALALYYLGSFAAYDIIRLNEASVAVVQNVAARLDKIEAAYYSCQFVLALFAWFTSSMCEVSDGNHGKHRPRMQKNTTRAAFFLFIRTTTLLVVRVRYNLLKKHRNPPSYLPIALAIIYGLTSFLIFYNTARAGYPPNREHIAMRIFANSRQAARARLVHAMDEAVAAKLPPPPLRPLIEDVKKTSPMALQREFEMRGWDQNQVQTVVDAQREYLKELGDKVEAFDSNRPPA